MNNEPTSNPNPLKTSATKMLSMQALLSVGLAWIFYYFNGQVAAQSALYGGCIVMFNVWITHRRLQTASNVAIVAPGKEVMVFYIAAIQRFIFTLGFFILGMGWLELPPIPMVATFAIAHLGYLVSGK